MEEIRETASNLLYIHQEIWALVTIVGRGMSGTTSANYPVVRTLPYQAWLCLACPYIHLYPHTLCPFSGPHRSPIRLDATALRQCGNKPLQRVSTVSGMTITPICQCVSCNFVNMLHIKRLKESETQGERERDSLRPN